MAAKTLSGRSVIHINYKKLHGGDSLPRSILQKNKPVLASTVLPEQYLVERILCRKVTTEGEFFLIKWTGYHQQESTWEPASHISKELVSSYLSPLVSQERLHYATETFERVVQHRLSTKNSTVTTEFPLDIYRYVFNTDQEVLVSSDHELAKLPLCKNWSYKINKKGEGVRISLPMRFKPRCYMRPVYVRSEDRTLVKMSLPVERLSAICAIEPIY